MAVKRNKDSDNMKGTSKKLSVIEHGSVDKSVIQHNYPFEDSYKAKIDDIIRIENKKKNKCCVHVTSSTHERLMRRKKTGSQSFDSVIVELLNENIDLKRKLRTRKGAKDGTKHKIAIRDQAE